MAELLGSERRRLVDDLVASFDEVADSGSPQWWSFEAAPGWGKTRLVQELYQRLAGRQEAPAYWPPALVSDGEDVQNTRKRVAPDPVRAQLSRTPMYFWWGVSCLSRPGSEFEALVQDLDQFARHESGLERRWRELVSRRVRWSHSLGQRSGELAETALGEGAGLAASAANLAVPGLGLVMLLGKWGVQRGVTELRERGGTPEGSSAHSAAEELGPELERLGNAGLPLVVVVEDVHAADSTLVELLVRLMVAKNSRVLLVTTCWPGLMDETDRPVSTLYRRAGARRIRGGVDISDLSVTDRAELARTSLTELDGAAALLLARRYANPLALQTVCRLGAIRREAARGALSVEAVQSLPADVTGLYAQLWRELPEAVQEALVLAVLSAPTSIGEALNFGDDRWDPAIVQVAVAAASSLRERTGPLLGDLAIASDAYAWTRTVEDWLQRFHEPAHRDVALAAAGVEYAARDRDELYGALARTIQEERALAPVRREHADRMLLTLASVGFVATSSSLLDVGVRVCAKLARSPSASDQQNLLTVAKLVGDGKPDDTRGLQVRGYAAAALARLGRLEQAAQSYVLLLTDQSRVLGPEHPAVLTSRNDLAVCIGRTGRVPEAVQALELLLDERVRLLGPDAAGTLTTQGNLATWLAQAGRLNEAIEMYGRLLLARERVLGPAAPDTLRTQSNLAWWLGEAGRLEDAIAAYEAIRPIALGVFGPDAPDTLTIESNLANWLGAAGRVQEAAHKFGQLVADRTRVLGPEAPDTLRARGNLAWWVGASGRVSEAVSLHEAVFAHRVEVLGTEAPDTLRARGNLAWWVAMSGNVEAAVMDYEGLLRDQARVLGEDAPDVQRTRDRLVFWRESSANRVSDAF